MKTFLIALTTCLFISLPVTHAFTFNGKTKEELHTASTTNTPATAPAHEKTSPKRGEFTIGGKPMKTEKKTEKKAEKKLTHSAEDTAPEIKATREEKKEQTTATTRPQQQTGGFFGGLFEKKTPKKEPSSTRTTTPFSGSVNINTASASELAQLNGIGPAKAAAIIAYRKQHGNFSSVNQLSEVSGIGPATVAKLKKQATVR